MTMTRRRHLGRDSDEGQTHDVAVRLAMASGATAATTALCYVLFVWTSTGQRFDDAAFATGEQPSSQVVSLRPTLTHYVNLRSLGLVAAVLVLIGFLRRRPRLGIVAAFAALLAVAISDGAKARLLAHPTLVKGAAGALTTGTFPSGHTVTAMACALALILVVPPSWRGPVAVAAAAFTCVVGLEMQTALWHRPSDIIGAALLAFAIMTGAAALVARFRPVLIRRNRPNRLPVVLLSVIAVVAAGTTAWALCHVVGKVPDPSGYSTMSASAQYDVHLAGLAGAVFVVVFLITVFLVLIGRTELDQSSVTSTADQTSTSQQ
jgi:membrane-associated phospholipid phosphatase